MKQTCKKLHKKIIYLKIVPWVHKNSLKNLACLAYSSSVTNLIMVELLDTTLTNYGD